MAKDKKDLAERKKMLKQIMAGKREKSNKRKAGNADKDAMALASSHSVEELETMEWSRMTLLTQAKRTRRMTTSERQRPPRLP